MGANKYKENGVGWDGKGEMKKEKKGKKREHGVEVVRRREEREVTRSETNKRRIKGGKMHAYPHADRRKLNQAEVCLLEERKGERKSMQVFPWNNPRKIVEGTKEKWELKRYVKYEIQDWIKIYFLNGIRM